jgi:hypothetical protein
MPDVQIREGAQWALLLAIEQHVPDVLTDLRDSVLPAYGEALDEQPDYRNRGLAYLVDDVDKRLQSVGWRVEAGETFGQRHARRLEKQKVFRDALIAWAVRNRISDPEARANRWLLETAVATLHRWYDEPRAKWELRWRYPCRTEQPRAEPGKFRWREKVETEEPVAKREFRWLARYVLAIRGHGEARYMIEPDVDPAAFSRGHKKAARLAGFEILPPP